MPTPSKRFQEVKEVDKFTLIEGIDYCCLQRYVYRRFFNDGTWQSSHPTGVTF